MVVGRRHIGERDRQQRAADAIADGVDLSLAGDLLDGVKRRERALPHVPQAHLGVALVGLTQEITNTVNPWPTPPLE